ncbi:MAG: DUF1304 domain-containing protein [Turneriella sp.]
MNTLQNILTGIVALIHCYIMVLESFLWKSAYGLKTFQMTPERAEATAVMAQNQGAYNFVLAAGLIWSFLIANRDWQKNVRIFFLLAVFAMGLIGAYTAILKILFVQSVPALLALAAVWLANRRQNA